MARSRNIKPAFFLNDEIADLQPLARLLFIGLWTVADYKGRMEYRPKRIKAEILPYDDCDVAALLEDLAQAQFITIYNVEEKHYVAIANFAKHQHPHPNEVRKGSSIPDHPQCATETPAPKGTANNRDQSRQDNDSSITDQADSLLLIPSITPKGVCANDAQERFDDFWLEYPRKKDKAKAKAKWKSKKLDGKAEMILEDVRNRKINDHDWLKGGGEFIPYPSTYLNGERWEDEITPRPKEGGNGKDGRNSGGSGKQNHHRNARDILKADIAKHTGSMADGVHGQDGQTVPREVDGEILKH